MTDNSNYKFNHSAELADHEREQVKLHIEKVSKIAHNIEDILITEDCTWQDWHEVVAFFNGRNELVIPNLKIKEIKQRYDGQSTK